MNLKICYKTTSIWCQRATRLEYYAAQIEVKNSKPRIAKLKPENGYNTRNNMYKTPIGRDYLFNCL